MYSLPYMLKYIQCHQPVAQGKDNTCVLVSHSGGKTYANSRFYAKGYKTFCLQSSDLIIILIKQSHKDMRGSRDIDPLIPNLSII